MYSGHAPQPRSPDSRGARAAPSGAWRGAAGGPYCSLLCGRRDVHGARCAALPEPGRHGLPVQDCLLRNGGCEQIDPAAQDNYLCPIVARDGLHPRKNKNARSKLL